MWCIILGHSWRQYFQFVVDFEGSQRNFGFYCTRNPNHHWDE